MAITPSRLLAGSLRTSRIGGTSRGGSRAPSRIARTPLARTENAARSPLLDITGILGVLRSRMRRPPRGEPSTIHQIWSQASYGVGHQQLLRRESSMTRADLVKAMADSTGMSQTDVDKVLGAFLDEVSQVVAKDGEKLTIPGFLTFERAHRNARTGRNPQTGEPVDIPATNVAKVTVGSKLKAAAKGG